MQAAENLLDDILTGWNGNIMSAQCYSIISTPIQDAAAEGIHVVFWLFDPSCGSHISNVKKVFLLDALQVPTTDMFTAQGYPMVAQFKSSTTCVSRLEKTT